MVHRRRSLLRTLGVGVGLGVAGCLTRGASEDESDTSTVERSTEQRVEETDDRSTPRAAEDDERTDAERQLAATTDRIMDELAWFAGEYEGAIDAYREAGQQVVTAVSEVGETVPLTGQDVRRLDGEIDRPRMDRGWPYDVWWDEGEKRWRRTGIDWQDPTEDPETPPLDSGDVDRLRDEVQAFADAFAEQLTPQFTGAQKERQFGVDTLDVIDRYNDLGDTAMVVAGLVRLFEHYETVTGATYVAENLSENPIRNRLAGYLASPLVRETGLSPLFELDYRGRNDHTAFSHSRSPDVNITEALYEADPVGSIDGATREPGQLRLQDAVEPLSVAANREDRCYCVVTGLQGQSPESYTADLPSQPIFVQRYRDDDSAVEARGQLFARDGVARTGRSGIAFPGNDRLEWTPIRFQYSGELWYALFRHVGRHLIVAGVGRRPLEHRGEVTTNWRSLLSLTWLVAAPDPNDPQP